MWWNILNQVGIDMQILNHGQIAQMALPDGWAEGSPRYGQAHSYERNFAPLDQSIKLSLWYRGRPVTADSASHLHSILQQPDHALLPSAIKQCDEILDWMSKPERFRLTSARTTTITGRRLLHTEGFCLETGEDYFSLFVPTSKYIDVIQEIHFKACRSVFLTQYHTFKAVLSSVHWHEDIDTTLQASA